MQYDAQRVENALQYLLSRECRNGRIFVDSKTDDAQEKIPVYVWPSEKAGEDLIVLAHQGDIPWGKHRHDYFVFNYIYRGVFNADVNGKTKKLGEGDVCILQPGSAHNLSGSLGERPGVLVSIAAKRDFMFKSFLPMISQSAVFLEFFMKCMDDRNAELTIEFSGGCSENVRQLMEAILVEAAEQQESYLKMQEYLFAGVLILLSRERMAETGRSEGERSLNVEPVLEYMADNYATLTLVKAAEHFNYNPSYLSSMLSRKTGKSFNSILKEFKLERARQLLVQTDLPVNTVASMVGYSHLGNFHKVFKTAFGLTPNALRKKLRGEKQAEA